MKFEELLRSFPENQIAPGAMPGNLVANWGGTVLHRKTSLLGRVWQLIHWIAGTGETAMKKAVLATAEVAKETLQKHNPTELVDSIINAYNTRTFWQDRNFSDLSAKIAETVRIQSFMNLDSWRKGEKDLEAASLQEAVTVMDLEKRVHSVWEKVGVSLSDTERELKKEYPLTDTALTKRRNALNSGWFGSKCPEKLLYSPLVAIGREVLKAGISKEDLSFVLDNLTWEYSQTKGALLGVVEVMKDPTAKPTLPESVIKAIQDPNWVSLCGIQETPNDVPLEKDPTKKYYFVNDSNGEAITIK